MSNAVLLLALLSGALLLSFGVLAGTVRYRLTEDALEVAVLWMVWRRVPLLEIEEVHRRGALLHENWSGLRFWNAVTIRRRRGLLRNLIVTPDNPDRFVETLTRAVQTRRAEAGR
jgi:hypothetical protein